MSKPVPEKTKEEKEEEEKKKIDNLDLMKHEVVVVVEGKKFLCYKNTLANLAMKFETMFYINPPEENMKLIELDDPITPEEFRTFLTLIDGYKSLNDQNVLSILRLCKLWNGSVATYMCNEFLMSPDCQMSLKEKFDLACNISQVELMTRLLAKIKTSTELNALTTKDVFKVNQPIIGMIFKRHSELPPAINYKNSSSNSAIGESMETIKKRETMQVIEHLMNLPDEVVPRNRFSQFSRNHSQ